MQSSSTAVLVPALLKALLLVLRVLLLLQALLMLLLWLRQHLCQRVLLLDLQAHVPSALLLLLLSRLCLGWVLVRLLWVAYAVQLAGSGKATNVCSLCGVLHWLLAMRERWLTSGRHNAGLMRQPCFICWSCTLSCLVCWRCHS